MKRQKPRGYTLIEVGFVLAVLAIVLSIGIPSYAYLLARSKLRDTGEALVSDLRVARITAVQEHVPVHISFHSGAQWCWGMARRQACDCQTGTPRCDLGGASHRSHPNIILQAGSDAEFEPQLGRATVWNRVGMSNSKNQQLHVDLNPMGRPQICGPDAPRAADC